jgi:hypothetical protein
MESPAVQRSGGPSWWVGLEPPVFYAEANRRAFEMSMSPIGKQVDSVQGLYALAPKAAMPGRRITVES